MSVSNRSTDGALNLLKNCLDVQPDNKVLVVCEDPDLGWYDSEAALLLTDALHEIGAEISTAQVGAPDDALPSQYSTLVDANDTIIYLARIGDQDRFTDALPGKNVAMLYTRDAAALASAYGSTHHQAMKDLKQAIDQVTLSANHITITCPLGTQLECGVNPAANGSSGDVTVKRFPLCVPQPVLANETSGQVALAGWLTPTGSRSYSPANCKLDSVVFADVENGRITGFRGEAECVAAIENHYQFVSDKFGIEKDVVHSWHAGIHPACSYAGRVQDDPDRWSNNIFGSPRYLHFHTCGNYPPGEICWMVLDPTIVIDGVALWEKGGLKLGNFDETAAVVARWPELGELVRGPELPIGLV